MRVAVIGAGAWGTAIAKSLVDAGHSVALWAYEREVVEQIAKDRCNHMYLPKVELPGGITPTNDLGECVSDKEMVVSVSPSHVVRQVMARVGDLIPAGVPVVSASKGIENDSLMTMSEVLEDVLPVHCHAQLAYLSGPSFAAEVAVRVPTAVVVAAYSEKVARAVQSAFANAYLRVYTSTDVIGVELGGALKNVIAIAAGAAQGMGLGDNSRAGMLTRGVHEITRLAVKKGANPLTLMGLSGMGDLILTCYGPLSRNRTVGELLGKGMTLGEIMRDMRGAVAEGVKTARAVHDLSAKLEVEMPISEQVYQVLYEDKPVKQAVQDLMARALKREMTFFGV